MSLNRVFVGAFVAVALCLALTSGADAGIFRRGCCPPADCCAPPPPVETTLKLHRPASLLYGIAEAHRNLGDTKAELSALRDFLTRHPNAGLTNKARRRMLELEAKP